ncbi:hypothetical protein San01_25460 [Streptomyces angustmyceticus]|uniref:Uncharacterized protein n=1 Tax=Streptomyces angustmyceticus TaxID=285578 RepID=A0A5J4LEH8_9ACTN|nr:hypothetical protein San01_25460 [Streptomyces angustmyceticus]
MDGRQEFLQQVFAVTGRNTLHGHPRVPPNTCPPPSVSQVFPGRPRQPGAPYGAPGAPRPRQVRTGRGAGRPPRPARVRMGWRALILKQWGRV